MMDDIKRQIAEDFKKLAAGNSELKAMLKKLESGEASYLDADRYALELAKDLGKSLHNNLGGEKMQGDAYQELIREVLPKGLHSIYEDVADYAQTIQQGINKRMGIGLNAIIPGFNSGEANAITDKAASADCYDDILGGLDQDMMHMAQNVATDTMQGNAKLANDVGMDVTVTRIYDHVGVHTQNGGKYREDCEFCLSRCGTNVPYSEAIAKDMFRRHPGCGCEIYYTANGKTQLQTNWRGNQWTDYDTNKNGINAQERAAYAARKTLETDTTSGMFRKKGNLGVFSHLPERMSKKHIRELAKEFDISLEHVIINIDEDVEKLSESFKFAGRADPEKIGVIVFFPKAFRSKEELLRTLFHERIHVMQYRKYGAEYVQNNRSYFEDLAYDAEEEFIIKIKKAGLL